MTSPSVERSFPVTSGAKEWGGGNIYLRESQKQGDLEFVLLVKSEKHMRGVALLCFRMYILNRGVRHSPHVDSETGNYEKSWVSI